jgi:hypothetical protein
LSGILLVRPIPALADAAVSASPATVNAGDTTMVIAGCGSDSTSATLSGTSFGGPSQIALAANPSLGPNDFSADVTIPASTQPGTYDLSVTCSSGEEGVGMLVVAPTGAPGTGDGATSIKASRSMLLGAALMVFAGAGLLALIQRIRNGGKGNGKEESKSKSK